MTDGADPPPNSSEDLVFAAVERFIEQRQSRTPQEIGDFVREYPAPLRARIEEQCRGFVALDDVVGPVPGARKTHDDGARRIGDFVIEEELGRGGMGIVYKAKQISLDRTVALKVMASGLTLSSRHVDRFRHEATAAARLQHSGIAKVYSSGEADGTLFTAMEYVAGHDLGSVLATMRADEAAGNTQRSLGVGDAALYSAELAECVAQIAEALAVAHDAGIVHRDVKPSNVMIGRDGCVRVVDFGLAKALDLASVSVSGELTGTPHYMSPEQTLAKRAHVDHRSDIFSLGVILYELLTLQRPFCGDDLQTVFYATCFQEPPSISELEPSAPRDLVTIAMKALEKDPGRRYQSAAEFAADLRRFLCFKPIHAKPAGIATRAMKWVRRNRVTASVAGVVIGMVLVGAIWGALLAEENERELARIVSNAEDAEAVGDFRRAFEAMTRASAMSPLDDSLRLRADRLRSDWQRHTSDVTRLLAESSSALDFDPDLALSLALESAKRSRADDADALLRIQSMMLGVLDEHVPSIEVPIYEWPMAHSVALTPDGNRVAISSALGIVRVFDIDALKRGNHSPLFDLRGHAGHVHLMRVSGDGQTIVSGGEDRTVRAWSLVDGRPVAVLHGFANPIRALEIRDDSSVLVAADRGSHLRIWSLQDSRLLWESKSENLATAVRFIPRSDAILYQVRSGQGGAQQESIRIRRFDGTLLHEQPIVANPPGCTRDTVVARDGTWYALCSNGAVERRDAQTHELLDSLPVDVAVHGLAGGGPSSWIAIALSNRVVKLWKWRDKRVEVLTGPRDATRALAFTPDKRFLVATCADRNAYVWRLQGAVDETVLTSPVAPSELSVGESRIATQAEAAWPRVWDFTQTRAVRRVRSRAGPAVSAAAVHPRGYSLTGSQSNLAHVRSVETGDILNVFDFKRPLYYARFGRELVAAASQRELVVWKLGAALSPTPRFRKMIDVRGIDIANDDELLVYGDTAGTVFVSRLSNGEIVARIERDNAIREVRLSPDKRFVAVAEHDNAIRIYDWRNATIVAALAAPGALPVSMTWSHDGRFLGVTRESGHARVWDVAAKSVKFDLVGHRADVQSIDFDPDMQLAVTASFDGTVRVWSMADGAELVRNELHDERPTRAFFHRDGASIWSCDTSGEMIVWPADPIRCAQGIISRPIAIAARERYGLMRPTDVKAKTLVDELYREHILTLDVQSRLASLRGLDPDLRAVAKRYAIERPNRTGFRLWVPAYNMIQNPRLGRRELEEAFRMAKAAARINPEDPASVRTLGYVHYRRGRYEDAWAMLDKPAAHPDRSYSPAVRGYRTMCLLKLGRVEEAREEFAQYKKQLTERRHVMTKRLMAEIHRMRPDFIE